ncbi:MAG TPA: hypothetical protein VH914_10910, partial [Acidimicrobiia bacterium]|nr:hypothetical protein [Acidimicrobiia bacterium]
VRRLCGSVVCPNGRTPTAPAHNEVVGKSLDAERDVFVEGERPPPIKTVVGWRIERTLGFIWIGVAVASIQQLVAGQVTVGLIGLAIDLAFAALWVSVVIRWAKPDRA